MRDLFFLELQKCIEEIQNVPLDLKSVKNDELLRTIDELEEISLKMLRGGGRLALEEYERRLADNPSPKAKELHFILEQFINGEPGELLEEIYFTRFISSSLHDYDALRYLLTIRGFLLMDEGYNARIIRLVLLNMLPEDIREDMEV